MKPLNLLTKKLTHKTMLNNKNTLLLFPVFLLICSFQTQAAITSPNKKIWIHNPKFNNFDSFALKINMASYPMLGDYRFLKISDDNKDILFLGEVSPNKLFSLPLSKLKSTKKLTIEIFSENAQDKRIVLVKQLRK